ncbi:hypothetical protein ABWL39_09690 [Chitinivorax sp. PXF-14]|uniref:hypothetical protein n=1 Tax=Chitinivorax sp. PXF-14 TaxID=3230488 RepID=UPI003466B28E
MRGLLTCIMLCAASLSQAAPSADESLGRLFFSPAERQAMARGVSEVRHVGNVRVDGYVAKRGGRPVVWVNGTSTAVDHAPGGVSVMGVDSGKHSVQLHLPDGRNLVVRPGDASAAATVSAGR